MKKRFKKIIKWENGVPNIILLLIAYFMFICGVWIDKIGVKVSSTVLFGLIVILIIAKIVSDREVYWE